MSVYFKKGSGWRYDFTLNGTRRTGTWFKTKVEAKQAEARRREEVLNPQPEPGTPTDITFLDLVNRRLDHVKAYNSNRHYSDYIYLSRRWIAEWGTERLCGEITPAMVESFILKRARVTAQTANKDIRYLRAVFNFGIGKGLITANPTKGIPFLPVERKLKYIPSKQDVAKVILVADPDTQDYLYTIKETMARVGEINRLTWQDINFGEKYVVLYTRKKKGGHLTPRKVPMTDRVHSILQRRYKRRDKSLSWVFCHQYWDTKQGKRVVGPYQDRKKIMKVLCAKAGVRYFRFHALRHQGASLLDSASVNIGSIQRILGHENRTTTEIYLHSIGESERDAMRIFEAVSEDSHTNSHTAQKKGLSPSS